MKYRKLRIAWSVTWGAACMLLVALWIRSYSMWHQWFAPGGWQFSTADGYVYTGPLEDPHLLPTFTGHWTHLSNEAQLPGDDLYVPQTTFLGFFTYHGSWNLLYIPYWFLVLATGASAAAPWMRAALQIRPFPRFSLRALFIATTLVAIVLGLLVWASR